MTGSAAAMDAKGGRIRVLICDDHHVVAQGLAMVLGAEPDIEVVGVAGSVAEVRQMVVSRRPQVVLMDYGLPDGDGVTATAGIKASQPDVQVIMLTSYVDEEVLVSAIEAGCTGYVTKHKGAEELTAAVRLAFEGEALVSPDMLARLLPRLRRGNHRLGWDLTPRERQVLDLLALGESKEAIARRLFLSTNTVRNHIQNILTKLEAHSRLEAVAAAAREGLLHRV
jgi:two-component system response regulator DevR